MRGILFGTVLFCTLTLAGTRAFAQEPTRLEIAGGYQALRMWGEDGVDNGETIEKGWYGDIAARLSRRLSAVIHVGANYESRNEGFSNQGLVLDADVRARFYEFAAGVRANGTSPGSAATPFGQVLIGSFRASGSGTATAAFGDETFSMTTASAKTKPMIQVGGGVDVPVGRRLGVRAGLDYLRVLGDLLGDGTTIQGLRAGIGLRVGF